MSKRWFFVLAGFLAASGVWGRQNSSHAAPKISFHSLLDARLHANPGAHVSNGADDTQTDFSEEDKEMLIRIVNEARQNVVPQSSNMMRMRWDQDMEDFAQEWTSGCDQTAQPNSPDYFVLAENVLATADGVLQDVIDTFRDIFIPAAALLYDRELNTCSTPSCETYLHLIRHHQTLFGCSIHLCFEGSEDANFPPSYYFLCALPLLNDIFEGESVIPPYEIGTPCSACPSGFPTCDAEYSLCTDKVPANLELVVEPGPPMNPAGKPFVIPPMLKLYDDENELYIDLANPACPWYVGVQFGMASHPHAKLLGKLEVPVVDGYATFEDLAISESGEYILDFFVSFPAEAWCENFYVSSDRIQVSPPIDFIGSCTVEEGEPRFERTYEWGDDCSSVCVGDCEDQHKMCQDLDVCGPHAGCIDSKCLCKGFDDFEYNVFDLDRIEETIRPEVRCMPTYIELRLNKCGMNALGYKLADLYILGGEKWEIDDYEDIDKNIFPFIESCVYNDCRGEISVDENGLWYSFALVNNFDDCNGDVETTETHLIYRNKLRGYGGFSNALISRRRPIEVEFSCSFAKSLETTVGEVIRPFVETAKVEISGGGEFDVTMGLWTDSSYQVQVQGSPQVVVGDPSYVAIVLNDLDVTDVRLYADECFATLTDDVDDPVHQYLIQNGCPAESSAIIPENGDGNRVLFSFKAFVFGGHHEDSQLNLHCKVNICFQDTAPCTTSCVSRRRRSPHAASDSVSTVISLGPISVRERPTSAANAHHERYASSFAAEFATQEVANPPFARTTGLGVIAVKFT